MRNLEEKEGGILPLIPLIIGAITAASTAAGVGTSIAKTIQEKKAAERALAEQRRHNLTLEAGAKKSALARRGKGFKEAGAFIDNAVASVKPAIKKFVEKIPNIGEEGKRIVRKMLESLAGIVEVKEAKDGRGLFLAPPPRTQC